MVLTTAEREGLLSTSLELDMIWMDMFSVAVTVTRTEEASEPHFMIITIFELAEDCHDILYFGLGKVNLHAYPWHNSPA